MSTTQTFKGVSNINKPDINEMIRDNVITFIDWGMLNAGGFYNVSIPTSGAYGGNAHILRPVSDPRYTNGQVWEGFRSNWVWESGISTTTQPINISGVFVGTTFYPNGSGFYIDYPNGRVIFNAAISTSSVVKVGHSFKLVKIIDARRMPFFQQLQSNSFRVDDASFLTGSGIYGVFGDVRMQLPIIAIEMPVRTDQRGYELGSASQWLHSDILLHVLAEDDSMAMRLTDALIRQDEKTILMCDLYRMGLSNDFPLDYRGSKNSSPKTYNDLVKQSGVGGYLYEGVQDGKMRISGTYASNGTWLGHRLYHKSTRWTTESVLLYS